MSCIIFDTETTGLIKNDVNINNLNNLPNIVQFSYFIFNFSTKTIDKTINCIIKMQDDIIIPDDSIKIHGVTNEISNKQGVNIENVIDEFVSDLKNIDEIVGHNIDFDIKMVICELLRLYKKYKNNKYYEYLTILLNKKKFCTLKNSIDICCIKTINKNGKEYNKYPKLSELHNYYFKYTPNKLHNSLADIIICLRCYYKMKTDDDLLNVIKKNIDYRNISLLWNDIFTNITINN